MNCSCTQNLVSLAKENECEMPPFWKKIPTKISTTHRLKETPIKTYGRMFQTLGRVFETCGRVCETCGRVFETCGRVFEICGRVFETCGRVFEICGRAFETCGRTSDHWFDFILGISLSGTVWSLKKLWFFRIISRPELIKYAAACLENSAECLICPAGC